MCLSPRGGIDGLFFSFVLSDSVLVRWRFAEYGIGLHVDKLRKLPSLESLYIPGPPRSFPWSKAFLNYLGQ